jgi:nuclear transport factor 2 (NTF2) superfamily protein
MSSPKYDYLDGDAAASNSGKYSPSISVSLLGQRELGIQEDGLMAARFASINDLLISESDRKYHWPRPRKDNHPGLSDVRL